MAGAASATFAQNSDNLEPGIYANFHVVRGDSTLGDILIKLEEQKAPMTVANFVGLPKET